MIEKNQQYVDDVKKYVASTDEAMVNAIVRYCGIALRSKDAARVSCSQKHELERVRENFLKKKLGLAENDAELDKAIKEVCEQMGASNKNKSRVTFYYLLAEKFGKQSALT